MPNLDDSLSDYVAPDFNPDFFPTRKDGKGRANRLEAEAFNLIGSCLIATQERFVLIEAAVSGNTTYATTIRFAASGSLPLVGTTGWVGRTEYGPPTGEYGISSGYIDNSRTLSGTGVATEFFYGSKTMDAAALPAFNIGWYQRRNEVTAKEGGCLVGNYFNGSDWLDTHPYARVIDPLTNQDLALSASGRPLRITSGSFAPTPYKAQPNYEAIPIANRGAPRRIIIASGRGSRIGKQALTNRYVYNPPPGVTGTAVPTGHAEDGKTLLGPCFTQAAFYIPPTNTQTVAARRNRFVAYPLTNSHWRHAQPGTGKLYAHVLVFGEAL